MKAKTCPFNGRTCDHDCPLFVPQAKKGVGQGECVFMDIGVNVSKIAELLKNG